MKKHLKTLFILALILDLIGCTLIPGFQERAYKDWAIAPLTKSEDDKKVSEDPKKVKSSDCSIRDENISIISSTERNRKISQCMQKSIEMCTEEMKKIYGNEAAFNIASGTIATLTSGWAAISTGGHASTLSAISAFSSGERSLVNETVYKNILTHAVGTKISEMRELKGNAIQSKLKNSDIYTYPMWQAMNDLYDYHQSCSFYLGLQVALKEGTDNTIQSKINNLEAKSQSLANQILAYTGGNKDTFNNGTNSIKDPILRHLLQEFDEVNSKLTSLKTGAGTDKPASDTPDVAPSKDKPVDTPAEENKAKDTKKTN